MDNVKHRAGQIISHIWCKELSLALKASFTPLGNASRSGIKSSLSEVSLRVCGIVWHSMLNIVLIVLPYRKIIIYIITIWLSHEDHASYVKPKLYNFVTFFAAIKTFLNCV